MSEKVTLYNIEGKNTQAVIDPINGDNVYDLLQIPDRFGFKVLSSDVICVAGDELRTAISHIAEVAQRCYIRVIHTEIEASDNLPYIHFEKSNIQIDGYVTIRDFNIVGGRVFHLSAIARKDSNGSETLVRVGVGRGEFVVKVV